MSDSEQQLFLIEFLIERVNIPSVRAMLDEMLPVTTCVSFQVILPNFFKKFCSDENCFL